MPTFRNRIVSYGVKPASQFLANPKNARLHPQLQRDVMKSVLETVGFVAPVIEANSGYLLDGHERIWQAMNDNDADVPFVVVDVDESEEDYVLLTFDPITALAAYDQVNLESLLKSVNSDNTALQAMLADLAGENGILPDVNAAWSGMPEMEQDTQSPFHSLIVHFNNNDDMQKFAQLIQQTVTKKSRYKWFPENRTSMLTYRVIDES